MKHGFEIVNVLAGISLIILSGHLMYSTYEGNSYIGDEIILKQDTLMVVDYKSFSDVFVLEDGREISADLAEQSEWIFRETE